MANAYMSMLQGGQQMSGGMGAPGGQPGGGLQRPQGGVIRSQTPGMPNALLGGGQQMMPQGAPTSGAAGASLGADPMGYGAPGSKDNPYTGSQTRSQTDSQFGDSNERMKQAALQQQQRAGTSYGQFQNLVNNPNQSLTDMVNASMGTFNKELQGVRENSIARGMSTGDLGTANEGSLASAFQKNIAGEAGQMYGQRLSAEGQASANDQNNYLDLVSGQRDADTQIKNAQKQGSFGHFLGGLVNTAVGSFAGAAGRSMGG